MYIYAAYLNNSKSPVHDLSRPLIISCCGLYRNYDDEVLSTIRPIGSNDYQLLYIASGKAYFTLGGKKKLVTPGHMVLYQPYQEQNYEYYGKDNPEVYWIHFTGSDVKKILEDHCIPLNDPVFYVGFSSSFAELFKSIINELLTCRIGYQDLLTMYFRQLLLTTQRSRAEKDASINMQMQEEVDLARKYFYEHYNEQISIEDYAASRNMSICWFQRNFKKVTGQSPMQFILDIRVSNAVNLLQNTTYSVKQISKIVGYDNPLYFSRLFKNIKGISPSEYRESSTKAKTIKQSQYI